VLKFENDFGLPGTSVVSYDDEPVTSRIIKVGEGLWFGFTTVSYAHKMMSLTDNEIVCEVLAIFKSAFPDANLTLKRSTITRWMTDPLSLGSYANRGPQVDPDVENGENDPLL
jgi:monoamine oxidase